MSRNDTITSDVWQQVYLYFRKHLPRYTVLKIRNKSYHPDDHHLYMVSAKKNDGTYAVWTCWNQETKCLNHGHYDLQSEEDCEATMNGFYFSEDSK